MKIVEQIDNYVRKYVRKYVHIAGTIAVLMSAPAMALGDDRHAPGAMGAGFRHQPQHAPHQVPVQLTPSKPDFSILPPSAYPQQVPPLQQPRPFPDQERLRQERLEQEQAWRRWEEMASRERQEQARRQQQREEQNRNARPEKAR
jgi:hypothetical protein